MHRECIYCSRDERLDNVMIEICVLGVSTLYLFKEQTYSGRCLLVLNDHEREFFHLTEQVRHALHEDISKVAKAIEKAFLPDKINYGIYGDTMPHMHVHIVPKFKGGDDWGKPFDINPMKVYLSDEEYQFTIERILKHLDF
jgi:diadenosine tetraphosphate (Ap4A) HIT family hydrolase